MDAGTGPARTIQAVDGAEHEPGRPGQEPATLVIHFDLDAYFASVETTLRPALAGRAVAVGGTGPGGVVTSASYPARAHGVRAAMPVSQARVLCPQLVVVAPRMGAYRRVSTQVARIAGRYGPTTMTSPDEGTVTLDGLPADGRWAFARRRAHDLQAAISDELGLSCSVGGGTGRTTAKIASELAKPGGIVICDDPHTMLAPLPVGHLPGIGPVSCAALETAGIRTVADLRHAGSADLERLLGRRHAQAAQLIADGLDPPPAQQRSRQVGSEHTLTRPAGDPETVTVLANQAAGHAFRRTGEAAIATVTVKLRGVSRTDVTRSRTLAPPTRDLGWLRQVVETQTRLAWAALKEPARLVGVTFELSEKPDQPALFASGPELEIPEPVRPTLAEIAWAHMAVSHPVFGAGELLSLGPEGWRVRFAAGEKILAVDAPLTELPGPEQGHGHGPEHLGGRIAEPGRQQ